MYLLMSDDKPNHRQIVEQIAQGGDLDDLEDTPDKLALFGFAETHEEIRAISEQN